MSLPALPATTTSTAGAEPAAAEETRLLGADAVRAEPERAFDLAPGTRVGRYVVVDVLGRGGMGVVYRAFDPDLNRPVALKLLAVDASGGTGPAAALRQRLQREAQALAQLNHPNVVAVYDVGSIDQGVFVAMEFVEGKTLRRWLDETPRPWRELLGPLSAAGAGLAAAHAAGLVHRDFKPDNVLIGNDGRVRVIDFGLARAADGHETESDEPGEAAASPASPDPSTSITPSWSDRLTMVGTILGTPRYMAPEQHRGGSCDALTDQFSFCVTLYRALYRQDPFQGKSIDELRRAKAAGKIEAPPSGVRIPARIHQAVVRGLAAEPGARHPSMVALLSELQRGRGRSRITALVALAVVGLAALAILGWSRSMASAGPTCDNGSREVADLWSPGVRAQLWAAFEATARPGARDTFERVGAQVERYQRTWADAADRACAATHVHGTQSGELLDRRMRCLERNRDRLGALLTAMSGDRTGAAIDKAVGAVAELTPLGACEDREALMAALPGPTSPEVAARVEALRAELDRAQAMYAAGLYAPARELATAVVEAAEPLGYPPVLAEGMFRRGVLELKLGELEQGQATLGRAIEVGSDSGHLELVARAWMELVWLIGYEQRGFDGALALDRTVDSAIRIAGNRPPLRSRYHNVFGAVLLSKGDYEVARGHFERFVELVSAADGGETLEVATGLNNIGLSYLRAGRFTEARQYLERALDGFERQLGPNHPNTAMAIVNLGKCAAQTGDLDQAVAYFDRGASLGAIILGETHPFVGGARSNLGLAHLERGDLGAADEALREGLRILETALGPTHPHVAITRRSLGDVARQRGDVPAALELHEASLEILLERLPSTHPDVAAGRRSLASTWGEAGRLDRAAAELDAALRAYLTADPPNVREAGRAQVELARVQRARGQTSAAATTLEQALERLEGDERARAALELAEALWPAPGQRERARAVVDAARADLTPGSPALEELKAWSDRHRSVVPPR